MFTYFRFGFVQLEKGSFSSFFLPATPLGQVLPEPWKSWTNDLWSLAHDFQVLLKGKMLHGWMILTQSNKNVTTYSVSKPLHISMDRSDKSAIFSTKCCRYHLIQTSPGQHWKHHCKRKVTRAKRTNSAAGVSSTSSRDSQCLQQLRLLGPNSCIWRL